MAGFTTVFTALGVSFTLVGGALLRNVPTIVRVAGVLIILMGLAMMGVLRLPWLYRERRFDLTRIPSGPRAAFALGMAFAFGWAPCIGPVLATVLATAAATQTVAWGAVLLMLYAIGLGIPFIVLALGFSGPGARWSGSGATAAASKWPVAPCSSASVSCSSPVPGGSSSFPSSATSPASVGRRSDYHQAHE